MRNTYVGFMLKNRFGQLSRALASDTIVYI